MLPRRPERAQQRGQAGRLEQRLAAQHGHPVARRPGRVEQGRHDGRERQGDAGIERVGLRGVAGSYLQCGGLADLAGLEVVVEYELF